MTRLNILIAEPREVIRTGLRAILEQDEMVATVYEAVTYEEIQDLLHQDNQLDLLLVHQSLAKKINTFPTNKLILLIDEPELALFLEAHELKVRGYLSTRISSKLLFAAIRTTEEACFLDPVFLPWIMDFLFGSTQDAVESSTLSS